MYVRHGKFCDWHLTHFKICFCKKLSFSRSPSYQRFRANINILMCFSDVFLSFFVEKKYIYFALLAGKCNAVAVAVHSIHLCISREIALETIFEQYVFHSTIVQLCTNWVAYETITNIFFAYGFRSISGLLRSFSACLRSFNILQRFSLSWKVFFCIEFISQFIDVHSSSNRVYRWKIILFVNCCC